jgi:hypothetical protein
LDASLTRYEANNGQARQRRIKKEARDRANALERQAWLGSLRNLFEIPGDSVDKR